MIKKIDVIKHLYKFDVEYWLDMAKKNPKVAALQIAILLQDQYTNMSEDELNKKWKKGKNG